MRPNIGMKIGMVLALSLAALAIVGVQSFRATSRLIRDAERVTHAVQVNEAIAGLLGSLHQSEALQRGYLLTGTVRYRDAYGTAVKEVAARLNEVRRVVADANQQRRLVTLEPLIVERLERLAEGARIRAEGGMDAAAQYAAGGVGTDLMNRIRAIAGDMTEAETAILVGRREQSHSSSNAALGTILYGIPAATVALSVFGFLLARNITRPLKAVTVVAEAMATGDISAAIAGGKRTDEAGLLLRAFARMAGLQREMARVAERIAAGDLRVRIQPQSDRDVLGKAFAEMVANLQRLTTDVTEAVNVLGAAASEIVASSTQLALAATETATAVTETTTTVEEVRQTAQLSSEKARSVADSAQKAAQVSLAGRKSTEESVESMKRIRQQMESIADSMARLGEQTQAIGQIIGAVDDLAAQSNVLAVNAAIEAAKAGEHGKGFAVVAREVKSLAEQSRQATHQVRAILHDIQRAVSAAAMATEQGSKAVEAGVQQSVQAGDSILALTGGVTEAAQAATQIAATNQQQLVGVEQVASAMENIKQSSAQNVLSVRQLETSARNLSGLGLKLKGLVARYETGEPDGRG